MVDVTSDKDIILARVGLTSAEAAGLAAYNNVTKYVSEAAAWLADQSGVTLVPTSCSEAEANAIRNLAAIYCYNQATGTSSTGWTANIGPVTFSGAPEKVSMIKDLWQTVKDWIRMAKSGFQCFKVGQANY
jgi:hypothetical protein